LDISGTLQVFRHIFFFTACEGGGELFHVFAFGDSETVDLSTHAPTCAWKKVGWLAVRSRLKWYNLYNIVFGGAPGRSQTFFRGGLQNVRQRGRLQKVNVDCNVTDSRSLCCS